MIPLCSPRCLARTSLVPHKHKHAVDVQLGSFFGFFFFLNRIYLLSFLEQTIKGSSTQYCSVNDLAWVFSCGFSTQTGQTAQKVAEGASHQDIIDLLKAHAEASSTADLLWARLTTFTSCHHDLFILQLFCLPSGKNGAVTHCTTTTLWKSKRLSQCGHFFSLARLPTCPVCVHRYAASATLSIKGTSQIDDETVSLWWTRRYRGDEERAVMDGLYAGWKDHQRALQANISTWSTFQIYKMKYDKISIFFFMTPVSFSYISMRCYM